MAWPLIEATGTSEPVETGDYPSSVPGFLSQFLPLRGTFAPSRYQTAKAIIHLREAPVALVAGRDAHIGHE